MEPTTRSAEGASCQEVLHGEASWIVDPGYSKAVGLSSSSSAASASSSKNEETDETLESERIVELGTEITILSAHLHAATYRLLTLIAEFDRREGWRVDGARSCAHWLTWNTGFDLGAARQKVRSARALEALPLISSSMRQGELSFAKVRALTRVATVDNEGELLEYARQTTAAQVERLVRSWKMLGRLDEQALESIRHESRRLSVFPDDEGMYVVRGRLDPEVGAILMRALEAAGDALFVPPRADENVAALAALGIVPPPDETKPEQRRADAIGLLAERALAAGFGGADERGPVDEDGGEGDSEDGGGEAREVQENQPPVSGSRAERYQVVLRVDPETLTAAEAGIEPGQSELEDGTRLSAETSRRLACDASLVRLSFDSVDGSVLDVGRRRRTIPPAIRRGLEARDRGCTFPGCGLRFTDAHHIRHWADGGETKLENLILLCRTHHRGLHEEGYRVELGPTGRLNFRDPRGLPLPNWPPAVRIAREGADALVSRNRLAGLRPEYSTPQARWKRELEIPWHVEADARDALDCE